MLEARPAPPPLVDIAAGRRRVKEPRRGETWWSVSSKVGSVSVVIECNCCNRTPSLRTHEHDNKCSYSIQAGEGAGGEGNCELKIDVY